jgi:amidase
MVLPRPDRRARALASVPEHYVLELSEPDVEPFAPFVDGLLASWDVVEELHAALAPAGSMATGSMTTVGSSQ